MDAEKVQVLIYVILPMLLAYYDAPLIIWLGSYLLIYYILKHINGKLKNNA